MVRRVMENSFIERPFIKSPFIEKILSTLDLLRDKKLRFGVASCLLLTGESGSGKSELAKHYVKNNPLVETPERTFIPVLHFELKSVNTPEEFLKALLVAVGDPQMGLGANNKSDLYKRLVLLLILTRVELLILDEIQVIIEKRSAKVITGIADLFKDLIKDTGIPIVFMGMPWSEYLVDSNPQLKGRISYRYIIPPYRISKKEYLDDYRRLLKLASESYGFPKEFALEEKGMTLRIFGATDGNLRATSNLLADVYITSKMENKKIGIELFAQVVNSYGVDESRNPFVLPLEKLELRELIVHSDWHFGYRRDKSPMIGAEYALLGVTENKKIFSINSAA
jgi:hypothetical protein